MRLLIPDDELRGVCQSGNAYLGRICHDTEFWRLRLSKILGTNLPRYPVKEVDYAKLGRDLSPHYLEYVEVEFGNYSYAEIMFVEAAQLGYLSLLPILLDRGVDLVKIQSRAIVGASFAGHDKVVKFILDNVPKSEHSYSGLALVGAARGGSVQILSLLVNDGANIHNEDDLPLREAVARGHLDAVVYLLEQGADAHGNAYHNALSEAAEVGNVDIAKLLLKAGADPNIGEERRTPTWLAASRGDSTMINLFFEHGLSNR